MKKLRVTVVIDIPAEDIDLEAEKKTFAETEDDYGIEEAIGDYIGVDGAETTVKMEVLDA